MISGSGSHLDILTGDVQFPLAVVLAALTAGAWYARRRWQR
jgi:hypothetical protein